MLQSVFKINRAFLSTSLALLVLLLAAIFIFPKPAVFIFLNQYHHAALDYLFMGLTFLGDGIFVVALALLFFLLRQRALAFLILSGYLLSGVFVQSIKEWFPVSRPALYFKERGIEYLNFIDHVTLHNHYSFPSGHTASAFAMAAAIAFFVRRKSQGALLAAAAGLIGFSRVYLGQHFPEDVAGGMALGLAGTWICKILLMKHFIRWQHRLNRSDR